MLLPDVWQLHFSRVFAIARRLAIATPFINTFSLFYRENKTEDSHETSSLIFLDKSKIKIKVSSAANFCLAL